jgi:hypothetical protein
MSSIGILKHPVICGVTKNNKKLSHHVTFAASILKMLEGSGISKEQGGCTKIKIGT